MRVQKEYICGNVKVVDRKWNQTFGVEDLQGNIIVPYGVYDWIDKYISGFARVYIKGKGKKQNGRKKWELIDTKGKLIVPT